MKSMKKANIAVIGLICGLICVAAGLMYGYLSTSGVTTGKTDKQATYKHFESSAIAKPSEPVHLTHSVSLGRSKDGRTAAAAAW